MKKTILIFTVTFLNYFINYHVFSQSSIEDIDDLYVDFSIPDNSAFKMLEINEDEISRPGNLKEFSIHFLNVISSVSNIKQGLAIDWAPLYTTTKSIKKYKQLGIIRNLSISLATAPSKNDTLGTDLAIGLSILPIDKSDPLLSDELEKSVNLLLSKNPAKFDNQILEELDLGIQGVYDDEAYSNLIRSLSVFRYKDNKDEINAKKILEAFEADLRKANQIIKESDKKWLSEYIETKFVEIIQIVRSNYSDEKLSKALRKILDDFKNKTWNAMVLQLNVGLVLNSNNSTWKNLTNNKFAGFISYSNGISSWGQYILNAQALWSAKDGNNISNKFSIGSRFLGGNSDVRGSFEFMLTSIEEKDNSERKNKLKAAIGFEMKLTEGIWIETAFGVDNILDDFNESNIVSLANFKYTFKKKPRYFD